MDQERIPGKPAADEEKRHVLAGGYSDGSGDSPAGLQLLREDSSTPFGWRPVDILPLTNPTFGVFDPERSIAYISHSGQGYLSAVAVDEARGRLRLLGSAATDSVNPAHLALSPDRDFVIAASFTSGHISVLEVLPSGELGRLVSAISTAAEPGPLRAQSGSQPHQAVFAPGGNHIFVPDRGCDRILVYRFEPATGTLTQGTPATARPASGPRHIVFADANRAFVVNELDNTVAGYNWDPGSEILSPVSVISTLPSDFFGASAGAGIAISNNGRFLFVSNRGHDSIARYRIPANCAEPDLLGWTPVQGATPRFIGVDPHTDAVWAAAQDSDRLQRFSLDTDSGGLELEASHPFPSPACVVFLQRSPTRYND